MSKVSHRDQVLKHVADKGLSSIMNNTKWNQLLTCIENELRFPPAYNRKDVFENECEPFSGDVSYWGDYSDEAIKPFYSIEWIEIRPRVLVHRGALIEDSIDSVEAELVEILRRLQIPYEYKNESYFIYGYASDFSSIAKH